MSAIREQVAQQEDAEAVEEPARRGGVPLAALLQQARRRGLVTLPAFLTVGLVTELCRALEVAHAQGSTVEGVLSLDTVQVGFDGRVRPTTFGEPRRDVAAVALVLDQLLGDTLDPELIRIIGDARLKDPSITTAVAMERRLAHWQVKQRQLFPGQDLTAALAAWLFPQQAGVAPGEDVEEWLEAQCTGTVLEEAAPTRQPSKPVNWRRVVVVALLLFIALLLVAGLGAVKLKGEVVMGSSAPEVVAPPVVLPVLMPPVLEAAVLPEIALPRAATGAPARLKLSSLVHGVLLETSGFPVMAPGRGRWGLKVVPARGQKKAPRYASLFVAELGDRKVARLSRVGAAGWLQLTSPEARLFLMQTDQPADDGSFNLAVGVPGKQDVMQPADLREDVLTDAMTQLESSRFVLGGLEVGQVYEVTQQVAAKGAAPPVIATVTIPNVHTRSLRGAGFKQADAPLDQVLLQPGVPVKVSGVSRLSFVVLTFDEAAEMRSTVDVIPRGPAAPPKKGAPALPGETCRDFAPPGVNCADLEQARIRGR